MAHFYLAFPITKAFPILVEKETPFESFTCTISKDPG
jgi:hypothetical protein